MWWRKPKVGQTATLCTSTKTGQCPAHPIILPAPVNRACGFTTLKWQKYDQRFWLCCHGASEARIVGVSVLTQHPHGHHPISVPLSHSSAVLQDGLGLCPASSVAVLECTASSAETVDISCLGLLGLGHPDMWTQLHFYYMCSALLSSFIKSPLTLFWWNRSLIGIEFIIS